MNHQPFRDWLVSDEQLTTEQTQALQNHMSSCESCREMESAWKEVELIIQKNPQVEPAKGFTLRWQENLVDYKSRQQSRKSWLTISATAVIATCLSVLLIAQLWSLIQAPGPYLAVWLNRLVSVIAIYYLIQNMVNSSSWFVPIFTFLGMFFLVGIISFMSVLWLSAYRKISLTRRVA